MSGNEYLIIFFKTTTVYLYLRIRHCVEMNIVAKEVTYIIHHAEVNTSYIQIKF